MGRTSVMGALLFSAATLAGCSTATSFAGPGSVRAATEAEKSYVGAALVALWSADPSLRPAPGCKIGLGIRQGQRINASVAPRRECASYDLLFTEGALALPSGQLRAITAHELGHIKLGHRRASEEPRDKAATLVVRAFDRVQEDEADAFAASLLGKIGKEACRDLAGTFRQMARSRNGGAWFSTHPAASDRAEQAEKRCGDFSIVAQFKASAQKALDKPRRKVPLPCDDGWFADRAGYVIDVTDWAENAGLKRGDRFISLAGIKAVSVDDWADVLARAPRGDTVDLEIERHGTTALLRLPCKDNRPQWEAEQSMLEAIGAERWDDCIASARRLMSVVGRAFTTPLTVELRCFREKIRAEKIEPAPEDYWRLMHRVGAAQLEAAKYRPGALVEVRGVILQIIDTLEKQGHQTLAGDLRDQLKLAAANP